MKSLIITSPESLDAAVAHVVRLKIQHTRSQAKMEAAVATVQKKHAQALALALEEIGAAERDVHEYCVAHRAELFPEKKSREISAGVFGFELTPHRVETASRRIKWGDVVARLLRRAWGKAYVRRPEPIPDKKALLADREKLTAKQQVSVGIQFCQDEQFFIRPSAETAEATQLTA